MNSPDHPSVPNRLNSGFQVSSPLLRHLGLGLLIAVLSGWVLIRGVVPTLSHPGGDFANYYTASRILLEGGSVERAYWDFTWFQKQIDSNGIRDQMGGFIPHPPSTALVFLPIAGLEPILAKRIWALLNVLLALAASFLLARITGLSLTLSSTLLLLSGAALINNFLFGQLYLLLLVSLLAGFYFHQSGHPLLAGICFGSLAPVKYVGLLWLLYFSWRRRWSLVAAGAATVILVLAATLWMDGIRVFWTFITEVLPRYLAGQVQDPFTVRLQTWNSLFRRLFLHEPTLNPNPLLDSPLLFYFCKNTIFWGFLFFCVCLLQRSDHFGNRDSFLFQLGLIPMTLLLIAPVGATYHFLLLTLSACSFTSILIGRHQQVAAVALALLFACIHLPHYLWLEPYLQGKTAVLGYTRLGLLLSYFLVSLLLLAPRQWLKVPGKWMAATLSMSLLFTAWQYLPSRTLVDDGATLLKIDGREFQRHLGLLLDSVDVGSQKLVFTYGELFSNSYSVFAADGSRWTGGTEANYYEPDLFRDDRKLLAETIERGQGQALIVSSGARGEAPTPVTPGFRPSWAPDGRTFAFLNQGRPAIYETPHIRVLEASDNCLDLAYSPRGESLAYTVGNGEEFSLRRYLLAEGREEILLSSPGRIQDVSWAPDASRLLFSWSNNGNTDIWALNLGNGQTTRLTRHPGNDENPVWDPRNNRIVFISDRDRGLQFGALYWLPIPHSLEK